MRQKLKIRVWTAKSNSTERCVGSLGTGGFILVAAGGIRRLMFSSQTRLSTVKSSSTERCVGSLGTGGCILVAADGVRRLVHW
jgi:hypothetical protein